MWRLVVLSICIALLSGCSSLSKDECLHTDWEALGFEDGAKGVQINQIQEYRQDCTKHGVQMDLARYKVGRKVGLEEFCQPHSGYSAGRSGYSYRGICAPELEVAFLERYRDGQIVYKAERRLRDIESNLSGANNKINSLARSIKKRELTLLDDETTSKERRNAYADLDNLKRRLYQVQQERQRYRHDVEHARREFREVEALYGL